MIKFLKTNMFAVKDPKGNSGLDAGIDFYCPEYTPEFKAMFMNENPNGQIVEIEGKGAAIVVPAHSDVNINSGIYTRFDNNIAFIGFNKSGIATKKKLTVGACVDDASYEGLLHLHVINTSNENQYIFFGEKVVQFVPVLIDNTGYEVYDQKTTSIDEFFANHNSERKSGGFGSTGLN